MTAALEGGEWSAARPGRTLPPGKDPVPILQEAGWTPAPVWTGGKSRPHRDSIPDRPARISFAIPTELPGPQYFGVCRPKYKPVLCILCVCVCVLFVLVIRHAKRMRIIILSSVVCLAVRYISTLSHKGYDSRGTR